MALVEVHAVTGTTATWLMNALLLPGGRVPNGRTTS
jgi:hypothetical protein